MPHNREGQLLDAVELESLQQLVALHGVVTSAGYLAAIGGDELQMRWLLAVHESLLDPGQVMGFGPVGDGVEEQFARGRTRRINACHAVQQTRPFRQMRRHVASPAESRIWAEG